MNKRQRRRLMELSGLRVTFDCSMSRYTTFGVGGPAEAVYEAGDLEELRRVLVFVNSESIPFLVVGGGSNLVVRDGGLEGVVILLRKSLAGIEKIGTDGLTVLAGGGASLSELIGFCRKEGLGGLEFLIGIPGTVGGAVAMNAGAFGEEIGSKIEEIQAISPTGDLLVRNRSQIRFSYRSLDGIEGGVIVGVCFELERATQEDIVRRVAACLRKRKTTQPLEYPSAGSVFKNPPNSSAGRLIEEAGLKGKRIGGAMISSRHANFIINTGDASANDILALLELAREKVKESTGIELEPELRVVGD